MGGQFQAEGEEQFHYSSLKSNFEHTETKSKSARTILAPKTQEITLDEPTPSKRPPTPHNPPPIPSTPQGIHQPLSAAMPDSPLTPRSSRVLNAGGVSTPSPPARTSNRLAGNNP